MNFQLDAMSKPSAQAIQDAIDACFLAGGGTVTLQNGEYFLERPLRLRSNVTLYLCCGVRLLATRDIEAYHILQNDTLEPLPAEELTDVLWTRSTPDRCNDFINKSGSRWTNAVIRLAYAENAKILAEEGAVIDGQNTYDPMGEELYRGAHGISIHHCKNIELVGYTIQHTGNWAHCAYFCSDLTFRNLTILAGHDGVHVAASDRITVEDCKIATGDDCVAGFDLSDLSVKHCTLNTSCNAFRLGGENITIEDCHHTSPALYPARYRMTDEEKREGICVTKSSVDIRKNTLSVFTYYSDFTLKVRYAPKNIVMRNCTFGDVDRFLHFNFSGNEQWQLNCPLEEITFENVTASGLNLPLNAYGSAEHPVSVTVRNCQISFAKEQTELVRAANYRKIFLQNLTVGNVNGSAVRFWETSGDLCVENCTGFSATAVASETPFTCKPI